MNSKKLPYSESAFVDQLASTMPLRGYLCQKEVKTKHGFADLVLSKLNTQKAKLRLEHNQLSSIPAQSYFFVLKKIPDQNSSKKPISISDLLSQTGLSNNTLKYKMLPYLTQHGYLKIISGNYYYKINGWVPLADEHIAVEAKLYDWKAGIFQALRYRSFAQKSYLAVPEETAHLVDINMLQKFNIGLISHNYSTKVTNILYECSNEDPWNADMSNYVSELFWKDLIETRLEILSSITLPERFQKFINLYNSNTTGTAYRQ